jgi:excisionase family DNA binding protein
MENRDKRLFTVKEVADYLRVNQTTIYRLIRRAEIPVFKVGGDWRFNIESIDAWRLNADRASRPSIHCATRVAGESASQTPHATDILVRIYEALSQMLGPIGEIRKLKHAMKRIAEALEDRRDPYAEIARLYRDTDIVFNKCADRIYKWAPFATGVADNKMRFVAVSDEYCRIFNRSRKHFRTMRLPDLVSREERESATELIDGLLKGKSKAERFVAKVIVAKAPDIVVRVRVWSVRTNRNVKPEYVTGILEPLANREQASAMFTRCADRLSKRREGLLARV